MGADWPVDEIMPLKVFARIKRLVGYAARLAQFNIGVAVQRLLKSKAPAPQSETPSEIEYYSLLAAEVSKLPNNTTSPVRHCTTAGGWRWRRGYRD
jgi:hypothetical protein